QTFEFLIQDVLRGSWFRRLVFCLVVFALFANPFSISLITSTLPFTSSLSVWYKSAYFILIGLLFLATLLVGLITLPKRPREPSTSTDLPEFAMIRLYPPSQPQERTSWSEAGADKFERNYELDADPVFEIMVKNAVSESVIAYKAGIRILQRIAGVAGTMGYSQPVEVQSEFTVHCHEEWKEGIIKELAWVHFEKPIEMKKGDSPYSFTLMLENFSDPDNASTCEVRFHLATDKGTAESRSIWLSQ
ncbi:MAG TPA: hypothetical protein VFE61_02260, partial [Candidatus Sulfotelmatobacter sp.]|nr:hypothetical protein [Candidatus Sulfotelmatobacter sp.]